MKGSTAGPSGREDKTFKMALSFIFIEGHGPLGESLRPNYMSSKRVARPILIFWIWPDQFRFTSAIAGFKRIGGSYAKPRKLADSAPVLSRTERVVSALTSLRHGIQLHQHLRRDGQLTGGEVFPQMRHRRRARNQQDVRGTLQQPGQRHQER